MRQWFSLGTVFALGIFLAGLLLGSPQVSLGQQGGDDALEDPLVRGAWLYEGNCIRCHGPYEQQRVGRGMSEDQLSKAIEGGSGGCSTDWSTRYGGPFRSRDVKAIIEYILAWEALGQLPELPPLPPQPTPTTSPTAASDAGAPGAPVSVTSAPTPAPTLDPLLTTALESNELALGAWLYTQNCHRCHLSYDQGRQGKGLTERRINNVITHGKSGSSMTAFSMREGGNLTATEIRSIVAYVMAWEMLGAAPALPDGLFTPPTPEPADLEMIRGLSVPLVAGDPAVGAQLYDQRCARCHGLRGEGALGPQLAKTWPSLRPDLTIRSTIANGIPNTLMPAWSQAKGGELSKQEIDDLVAFLLGLSQ